MKETSAGSLLQPRGGKNGRGRVVNRKLATFFLCILFATAFWFINALSKEYPTTLRLPVDYLNLPTDRIVSNRLPDTLDFEVKASGFNLLRWSISKPSDPVSVDMALARRPKGTDYLYFAFGREIEKISRQMIKGVKVVRVIPDTIWFSYAPRAVAKVPVRARVQVTCKAGYRTGDSVRVTPAEVEVSGPAELIQKITFVETEARLFQDADKTVSATLRLQPTPEFRRLSFSPAQVSIEAPVYRFTEARKEIPISVDHLPPGVRLQLLKEKVTVIYNVPIGKTDSVDVSMFRAVIDYRRIEPGATTAHIQVVRAPVFVSNIRLDPEKVEFLIRK